MLPTDPKARKGLPIATGCLDYFPLALAAVAEVSRMGNDKHNPGEPLHWSRAKSADHADCIGRHLIDRKQQDGGILEAGQAFWRAGAQLQLLLEDLQAKGADIWAPIRTEAVRNTGQPYSADEPGRCE